MEAKVTAQTAQVTQQLTASTAAANAAKTAADNATKTAQQAIKDLEAAEEAMAAATIVTLTHAKSGTVHELTGLDEMTGLVNAQFKATRAITEGDTLTIDGVSYAAQLTNGDALASDFWAIGATVGCIIDTEDKTVNFKGGGGVKLPALTNPAAAAQIVQGYQAINGEGVMMEGLLGAGITKAASAAQIFAGYEAINLAGKVMTGTAKTYGVYTGTITCPEENETTTFSLNSSGDFVVLAIYAAQSTAAS
jgi:hypothetical protein